MPKISMYGQYYDTYVRTRQGWRIKRREFQRLTPEPAL
jgi:hypothetical protein